MQSAWQESILRSGQISATRLGRMPTSKLSTKIAFRQKARCLIVCCYCDHQAVRRATKMPGLQQDQETDRCVFAMQVIRAQTEATVRRALQALLSLPTVHKHVRCAKQASIRP